MTDEEISKLIWPSHPDMVTGEQIDAYRLGWELAWEARGKRDAEVVRGGRFLSDDAPVKKWADEVAAAIEREGSGER